MKKNELCELKRLLNFYNAEKEEYVLLSRLKMVNEKVLHKE